jgi:hypothetical protein
MGDAIRDGEAFDEDLYADWILWHTELIELVEDIVQSGVDAFIERVSGQPQYLYGFEDDSNTILSSRVKTDDTTREKLQRQHTDLARILDIAGLRIDGAFTLSGQELLADSLMESLYAAGADRVVKRDLRDSPHSGYRAVHLHVKAPAGLLEIQIRTLSQSHWANLYETVGDLLGREVRYIDAADGPAGEVLSQLWKFSADAYENEKNWVVAQELVERTKALTENEKLSDDQLAEARQLVEEVAAIRHRLARQITEQVEYFAQQRGKLEKLRDTQSKEERS